MTTVIYLLRFALALAGSIALAFCAAIADPIPGQAIVRFDPGHSETRTLTAVGMTVLDSIPDVGLYLVSFPTTLTDDQKLTELLNWPTVRAVEPNRKLRLIDTHQGTVAFPDDDIPPFLNGSQPYPFYGQPAIYSIGLDSAHLITEGDGVRIAVVDNGINCNHPLFSDLDDSLMFDFVDNDSVPEESGGPVNGHGTFVTGLIRLAAPEADLMIVRAFDGEGVSTTFKVVQAINWAINHDADVINMSFGTPTNIPSLAQTCARATDSGIVQVASVGNGGQLITLYPASYPGVIAVGAIDSADVIASFSNGCDSLDLCAPGVSVYSALPEPYMWGIWSGTSFSAPFVSAIAGLVRSVNPAMPPVDVQSHFRTTATRDLAWGTLVPPHPYYGYGLVDAFAAVLAYRLGDLNNSGSLDIGDLSAVVEIAKTGSSSDGKIIRQADINRDGRVDYADVNRIALLLFGTARREASVQTR